MMLNPIDEHDEDEEQAEATREQLAQLREWGVREDELADLTWAEANEWLDELRSQREDAGRRGRR